MTDALIFGITIAIVLAADPIAAFILWLAEPRDQIIEEPDSQDDPRLVALIGMPLHEPENYR